MINEYAVKKITMPSAVKSVRDVLKDVYYDGMHHNDDKQNYRDVDEALADIRAAMPSVSEIQSEIEFGGKFKALSPKRIATAIRELILSRLK